MADRAVNREGVIGAVAVFARSLILLTLLVIGLPWALVLAARERFGGGAPLHGVPSPSEWRATRIRTALTDRLTEQTVADIVIRLALVIAWVGVIVIIVTVVAEVVHMVRHDGLAMPDLRGLGLTQRTARAIAAGLLVIIPLLTSPPRVIADGTSMGVPERSVAAVLNAGRAESAATASVRGAEMPPGELGAGQPALGRDKRSRADPKSSVVPESTVSANEYVVQPGDSIYGIAERLVGPDTMRVAAFAEQLVDVNLGRRMTDGRQFNNAAFIDVGWVLELPGGMSAASSRGRDTSEVHVVERGETLWSIAEDELGDPARWPELYDVNEGRTFADGQRLEEPDLIQPGWDLRLPADAGVDDRDEGLGEENPSVEPDDVASLTEIAAPVHTDQGSADPDSAVIPDHPDVSSAEIGQAASIEKESYADTGAPGPMHRDNVWDEVSADIGGAGAPTSSDVDRRSDGDESESTDQRLLPMGAAAMLSVGVLTLLAVRRRHQLRRSPPRASLPEPSVRPVATERALRSIDVGERFARVETAIRAVAMALVERSERVLTVFVGPEGGLELHVTGPVVLPAPWDGDGDVWRLEPATPLEMLADHARAVNQPCPTLVQLGTDEAGRDVYVDLEAMEAIEIGGTGAEAEAVVAAIAATLAGSLLAEVATLVGLGVADEAFLGHRRYVPVRSGHQAFEVSAAAIGSTASVGTPTFELRATGTPSETWEPAVVLVGASAGTLTVPDARSGLAVVSASPLHGPSSRLAPDGDAWTLQPAGIRLTPVGLTPDDVLAISELLEVADPELGSDGEMGHAESFAHDGLDEHTLVPTSHGDLGDGLSGDDVRPDHDVAADERLPDVAKAALTAVPPPPHEVLVRMIGPVRVVDRNGNEVAFERSKTRELVAWLATHRTRSTRSAARTALWELDVRDATFANVVSEARRSLARLVEPPDGEEWVARTMTDALPLHELVLSDADLLRDALHAARLQPPAQAIATLAPAVELIGGVPFDGTSYLWPDSEGITSNLVLLATAATTELAAHCLSIGDIEGLFSATARGLQVLPGHEELIGLRMEAHARAGDHAGVRHEWESYERVINGDPWSDGEPAPKLVDLRRRLLHPLAEGHRQGQRGPV